MSRATVGTSDERDKIHSDLHAMKQHSQYYTGKLFFSPERKESFSTQRPNCTVLITKLYMSRL